MTTQGDLRVLMFNLATDVTDPVLGFTTAWIQELAKHCDYIDLITMYQGDLDLPDNVRIFSAGREQGLSKPMRVLNFYRQLLPLLATRQYDVCFAHMMPLFAGLAGPLLTARGIRTVLWYTHRQQSRQLKLGMNMSWRVVSAVQTSFPYPTDKLRVIGHGINTDFYAPDDSSKHQPPTVIQVARLATIKHQDTTIQAIAQTDAHLVLVGDVQQGYPQDYKQELETVAQFLNIRDRVTFTGDLLPPDVLEHYRKAQIAVNMSPIGLFDKATLESMACAIPTIVCNPAFADLMGEYADVLIVDKPDDVAGLSRKINHLLSLSDEERATIGETLRQQVVQKHGLSSLIKRLVNVLSTGEVVV